MNKDELSNVGAKLAIKTSLEIFSPMVMYQRQIGSIPRGSIITITGRPGSGKSTYAIQLLDNIQKNNPDLKCIMYSLEMPADEFKLYHERINVKHIDDFRFKADNPLPAGAVIVIDTLDELALHHNKPWPDEQLASAIKFATIGYNTTIIMVHHRVKSGKQVSGAARFPRINNIQIELEKETNGSRVSIGTPHKNRYQGPETELSAKLTPGGLILAPTIEEQLRAAGKQFWRQFKNAANNLVRN